MRTTLQIDNDVLRAARSLAQAERKTVGQVISELARQGLRPRHEDAESSGFPVFDVPPEAIPITLEMVQEAEDGD